MIVLSWGVATTSAVAASCPNRSPSAGCCDRGCVDGALLTADAQVRPDDARYRFRDHLRSSFERYGIPANGTNFKGDVFVGEVVVDVASGRATFNGQPLQSDAEAELAARCQRILRDRSAQ